MLNWMSRNFFLQLYDQHAAFRPFEAMQSRTLLDSI